MDLKKPVASVLNNFGFSDAYAFLRRQLAGSTAAVMLYHRVCPTGRQSFHDYLSLSPKTFERQMEYFSRNYEILALDKLIEFFEMGRSLPKKSLVITFDDGYKDNFLHAYPILVRHNIPATIFLVTGHIDSDDIFWWDKVNYAIHYTSIKRMHLDDFGSFWLRTERDKSVVAREINARLTLMSGDRRTVLLEKLLELCQVETNGLGRKLILTWDEVREMNGKEITFGAHSVSHPSLCTIPLEQARAEIAQSKKKIEEKLGKKVTAFCYPFGHYNAESICLVKENGFKCAVAVKPNKLVGYRDNVYCLPRIPGIEDFNELKNYLCGIVGDLQARHGSHSQL